MDTVRILVLSLCFQLVTQPFPVESVVSRYFDTRHFAATPSVVTALGGTTQTLELTMNRVWS